MVEGGSDEAARYRVQAVAKALSLLDAFAAPPHAFTLTELSRRSGLSPNQTFRLLQTLVAARFVAHEPETRRYRLGLHLFRLASAARNSDPLLLAAGPVLDWARDASGETVNLVVKDGEDGAVAVATRGSAQALSARAARGAWQPLHAGASPKLLLALRDDDAIARYLAAHRPLPRYTPFTITDENALWAELRRTRERGHAVSEQENQLGACAVAAPIYDRRGTLVGAVSITAPTARFTPADRERDLAVAVEAARRLGAHLESYPAP